MSDSGIAKQFASALQQMEQTGDVESLAELFAADASLSNPEQNVERQGPEGVTDYWKRYLDSFDAIRSEFHRIRESDGLCVLEWESTGTWKNGQQVTYRGVSVLEVQEGRVQRFATYYDTAALRAPVSSPH